MNKVILLGRLGNIESRRTNTGKKVTIFSLATNNTYKNQLGEKKQDTQWHRVEYWDMSESLESCLGKGKQVAIEGELRYEDFEKDGVKRTFTKIVCNSLELLGGYKPNDTASESVLDNDDIPF